MSNGITYHQNLRSFFLIQFQYFFVTLFPVVRVAVLSTRNKNSTFFTIFLQNLLYFRDIGIGINLHTEVAGMNSFYHCILMKTYLFFSQVIKVFNSFCLQVFICLAQFDVCFSVRALGFERRKFIAISIMFNQQNRGIALFTKFTNAGSSPFINKRCTVVSHIRHIIYDEEFSVYFRKKVEKFRFQSSISRETEVYNRMLHFTVNNVSPYHSGARSTRTLSDRSTVNYDWLFFRNRLKREITSFGYSYL